MQDSKNPFDRKALRKKGLRCFRGANSLCNFNKNLYNCMFYNELTTC